MHKPKLKVALPEISPKRGLYETPLKALITCATPGADIFYTLDGTRPVCSQRNVLNSYSYSPLNGVMLGRPGEYHITARAWKKGHEPSDAVSVIYRIQGTAPHAGVADLILEDTFRRHVELDMPHSLQTLLKKQDREKKAYDTVVEQEGVGIKPLLREPRQLHHVLQDTHNPGSLRALVRKLNGANTDLVLYRTGANVNNVTRVPTFHRVHPPNFNLRSVLSLKRTSEISTRPAVKLDSPTSSPSNATRASSCEPTYAQYDWDMALAQQELADHHRRALSSLSMSGAPTTASQLYSPRGKKKTLPSLVSSSSVRKSVTPEVATMHTFVFEQRAGLLDNDLDEDEEDAAETARYRETNFQSVVREMRRKNPDPPPKSGGGGDLTTSTKQGNSRRASNTAEKLAVHELSPPSTGIPTGDVAASDRTIVAHISLGAALLRESVLPTILAQVPFRYIYTTSIGYGDSMNSEDTLRAFKDAYAKVQKQQPPPTEILKLHRMIAGARADGTGATISPRMLLTCCRFVIHSLSSVNEDVMNAPLRLFRDVLLDLCYPSSIDQAAVSVSRMDFVVLLSSYARNKARKRSSFNKAAATQIQRLILDPWTDFKERPSVMYSGIEAVIQEDDVLRSAFVYDIESFRERMDIVCGDG